MISFMKIFFKTHTNIKEHYMLFFYTDNVSEIEWKKYTLNS